MTSMKARTSGIVDVKARAAGDGSKATHQFVTLRRVCCHRSKVVNKHRKCADVTVVVAQRYETVSPE